MRTSQPGPEGQAHPATWWRWLLPLGGMVCEFGLSDTLGPVSYGGTTAQAHPGLGTPRGHSEQTQRLVDREVAALLTAAETRARDLLTRHIEALNQLTTALLERETITGDQVRALI
jgi:cell division protease FtsH